MFPSVTVLQLTSVSRSVNIYLIFGPYILRIAMSSWGIGKLTYLLCNALFPIANFGGKFFF